jgi:hypothetical protein
MAECALLFRPTLANTLQRRSQIGDRTTGDDRCAPRLITTRQGHGRGPAIPHCAATPNRARRPCRSTDRDDGRRLRRHQPYDEIYRTVIDGVAHSSDERRRIVIHGVTHTSIADSNI